MDSIVVNIAIDIPCMENTRNTPEAVLLGYI